MRGLVNQSGSYKNGRFKVLSALEECKALSSTARQIIFWLLIIAGALLIYKLVNPGSKNTSNIDLVQLYQRIDSSDIKKISIKATETVANDKNGTEYHIQ